MLIYAYHRENDGVDLIFFNYNYKKVLVKKFDAIVVKYAKSCCRAPWTPLPSPVTLVLKASNKRECFYSKPTREFNWMEHCIAYDFKRKSHILILSSWNLLQHSCTRTLSNRFLERSSNLVRPFHIWKGWISWYNVHRCGIYLVGPIYIFSKKNFFFCKSHIGMMNTIFKSCSGNWKFQIPWGKSICYPSIHLVLLPTQMY